MTLSALQWQLMQAANDATAAGESVLVIDWRAMPLIERIEVWWSLKGLESRTMLQRAWIVRRCGHMLKPVRGWRLPENATEIAKRRTFV